ncbi:Ig-like domain-containing protein [Geobacillus stearothermophilus]|uniref:Ig-like domain-containing protein n=1 Tax=Geobacillus stearothermophilus TaxID=1422 RepID=UPI003D21796D
MDKKKAVKLATASAVAASAFVAANPHTSQAATDVATVVSQAKAQFKAAYYAYSHTVTETGKLPNISDVYAAYNKAKQAYENAVAVVNKAGGAKKDAYLADLQVAYETYVFKANPKSGEARVATYIDAYNYATKLDAMRQELKAAVDAKDLKKAEELYHKISYELKTRTVILDRVYGQTTRELLRSQFKAEAQKLRDSLIYDITVAMKAREAQDAVKAGNLDKAKAALDQVNQYVSKVTDTFKAELQKAAQDAKAAYEAALTPKVESVSAIDDKTFKVTFSKEVKGVLPSNFVVTQKDNGARFYVSNVTLAEDKKSATVTLYDAMVEGKVYTVETSNVEAVDGQKVNDSDEFTYTKAVPASITLASKLPEADSVDLDDYVTVKDAAGNVIKSGYTVTFASNVDIKAGNVIDTSGKTSVTVNATITKADGTKITTGNVVIPVEAPKAASVETFKLVSGTSSTEVGTLFLDATKVLDKDGKAISGAVANNLRLVATFKDQFGKDIPVNDAKYESLTPTVLTVSPGGKVTPVSTGKALVRVTKGDLSKTIELEVKANPQLTTLEVADNLSVVGASTAPAGSLKVTLKDQYGNKFDGTVTATSSDTSVATVTSSASTTNGEATLTVQGLKEGTAKITITAGTLKKEVTVTAVKAGTVAGYKIEATDDTIDLNSAANNTTATIKVYEVDANGNKIKDITNDVTYELPADSLVKATNTKNVFTNADNNTKTGSTVVTVKAGTLTLGTVTINTVDTTDHVAKVEVVNPLLKLNTSELVNNFGINEIAKNIKMTTKSGKVLDNSVSADLAAKVAAIDEVISNDSSVVSVSNKTTVQAQTISGAKKTATLVVKFKDSNIAPIAFNVDVYDVTAPAAPTIVDAKNQTDTAWEDAYLNAKELNDNHTLTINLPTSGSQAVAGDTLIIKDGPNVIGTATLTANDIKNGCANVTITSSTLSNLAEDNHRFTAVLTDAAGNASTASNPFAVTVDKTAPTAATKDAVSVNQAQPGTYAANDTTNDTITIKFSEKVKVSNLVGANGLITNAIKIEKGAASNTPNLDASTIAATDADSNGYATTFVITLKGSSLSVAKGNKLVVTANKVEDAAGNTASANVEFLLP